MKRDIGGDAHSDALTETRQPGPAFGVPDGVPRRRNPIAGTAVSILGLLSVSLLVAAAGPPPGPSTGGAAQASPPVVLAEPEAVAALLSPLEVQASQIAEQNGDRDFLLLDKSLGRLILFQNGKPIYGSVALTGETMTDHFPADVLSLKFSEFMGALEYRVTPAGRFTLSRGDSKDLGPHFYINEIKGPDWTIPILQVNPVTPSERRDSRMKSGQQKERQITHGGINVPAQTIQYLASKLPEDRAAVLYIMPHDETKTAYYLTPRSAGEAPAALADPGPGSPVRAPAVVAAKVLSDQGRRVSQIAEQNGDRTYILVDKPFGKLFFFENGNPIYVTTALTGESQADRLPPSALKKSFYKVGTVDDKVTPAGRFTLTQSYDPDYGQVFSINEISGPDWEIAIHQVYLGTPAERRTYRLATRRPNDNYVSYGCINVNKETIRFLVSKLGKTKKPVIYILPHDQARTAEYFPRRNG